MELFLVMPNTQLKAKCIFVLYLQNLVIHILYFMDYVIDIIKSLCYNEIMKYSGLPNDQGQIIPRFHRDTSSAVIPVYNSELLIPYAPLPESFPVNS